MENDASTFEHAVNRFGLSQIYENSSSEPSKVDVVFVHGLNGHPYYTWTSDQKNILWPAQLLPSYVKEEEVRILVYGYDATVVSFIDGVSKDRIHNHAEHLVAALCANRRIRKADQRPIIFVAHSLGGLIVKSALIYSSRIRGHKTEHLRSIFVSTFGILFLGTPHHGSDIANWGSALEAICRVVLPKKFIDSESQLVQALKEHNETLQVIDRDFIQLFFRFHIYFFHESKPTDLKGTLRFIVKEESASPPIQDVERAGIQQDHVHMCKFEETTTPGFDLVTEAIQRYAREAPQTIQMRWKNEIAERLKYRKAWITEVLPSGLKLLPEDDISKPTPSTRSRSPMVTDDDIGLKVLYEAESRAEAGPSIDVVAIHGIGAHPDNAWSKSVDTITQGGKGSVNWLRDEHMLPAVIPNSRILRYGYRSDLVGDETLGQKLSMIAQRLLRSLNWARKDCPSRPLCFIAHCFGGLIVVQALIEAKLNIYKWPDIFNSTTGILFFGTPFRNGRTVSQEDIVLIAQRQYVRTQHISSLENQEAGPSKCLSVLSNKFLEIWEAKRSTRVVCFFEQKETFVTVGRNTEKTFMVDRKSGCLDSVDNHPFFRDHINIHKFAEPSEEDFLTVSDAIYDISHQAQQLHKTNLPYASPHPQLKLCSSRPSLSPRNSETSWQHRDYTVGWICSSPIELAAAIAMLDECHDALPQHPRDDNVYALGRIGVHNVVIVCLPLEVSDVTLAARTAIQLRFSFPEIRYGLVIGVGGGVPSHENDIRLGDVVVSTPSHISGGVIHYDYGRTVSEGRFVRTGSLNKPPDILLNAINILQARHLMRAPELPVCLQEMGIKYPKMQSSFSYPGRFLDVLYKSNQTHVGDQGNCIDCNNGGRIYRPPRTLLNGEYDITPVIHYGLIASATREMEDAVIRDQLRQELDVLCFEKEAAGLMDMPGLMETFPCLLVRGISNYADSHKLKVWQPYAAAVAAAYAKELLSVISSKQQTHLDQRLALTW